MKLYVATYGRQRNKYYAKGCKQFSLICATTNKKCLIEDAFVSRLFVQNPTFLGGSAWDLVMIISPPFLPGCESWCPSCCARAEIPGVHQNLVSPRNQKRGLTTSWNPRTCPSSSYMLDFCSSMVGWKCVSMFG